MTATRLALVATTRCCAPWGKYAYPRAPSWLRDLSTSTPTSPSTTKMKRCAGVPPSSPPASNSAVYWVNEAPSAGPTCTTAVQPFMPGNGVRTKVSAVSSRWLGCWELRVCPRLCTAHPCPGYRRGSQLIEQLQPTLNRLRHIRNTDRLRGVVADPARRS